MKKNDTNTLNSIYYENYKNDEIISFLNNISRIINNFFSSINQIMHNLKNVSSTLNKQIISSNYLIKEIKLEEHYTSKFHQLYARIGMLEDSRKLFKENIKLINYYLNNLSKEIKGSFFNLEKSNKNIINIEEINNFNFIYQTTLNSCENIKNNSNSNKHNLWLNTNINPIKNCYNTINYSNINNSNLYNLTNSKDKHNSVKTIIINSKLSKDFLNSESNKYMSHRNKLKIKTENELDLTLIHKKMNKSNNNDNKYHRKKDEDKYNSPIINKSRLIKKSYSLSNFIENNNLINQKRNKTSSYRNNNIISKTTTNNKNEFNTNPINSNNYSNIINQEWDCNKNKEYSFFLSYKLIQFINIIKEMKVKYNKKNCENKKEFKEIKQKYEKLKKILLDISKAIIYNYRNNTLNKNVKNNNNINIYKAKNNYDKNICTQNLMNQNKKNIEYQKNIIYSKASKDLKNNNINNINNKNINTKNLNSLNEINNVFLGEYKGKINELKIKIESQKLCIENKDKIIENLNKKIKSYLNFFNKTQKRHSLNKNKELFFEKAINFSINIERRDEENKISKSILDEKEKINEELKQEIESLKNKMKESVENNNTNHINNNIYIIKELKEKIKQISEENSSLKNKINSLLDNNKLLGQKLDSLANEENQNEIIKQSQEEEIKKLQLIIEDLQFHLNEKKEEIFEGKTNINNESKGKEEQIEFLLTENKELKNQIEELKEKGNISNSNSYSNAKEDEKINYKKLIDDYENKINFLNEQNLFYKNELNNQKTENYIVQNEFKTVKKENDELNKKIKEYDIKNDDKENLRENYGIICVKNIGNLSWVLLRKKDGDEDNYDDYIWIEKNIIGNVNKFNFID